MDQENQVMGENWRTCLLGQARLMERWGAKETARVLCEMIWDDARKERDQQDQGEGSHD